MGLNLWLTDEALIQTLACDIVFFEKSNKDTINLW